jgi:hypothetical protein
MKLSLMLVIFALFWTRIYAQEKVQINLKHGEYYQLRSSVESVPIAHRGAFKEIEISRKLVCQNTMLAVKSGVDLSQKRKCETDFTCSEVSVLSDGEYYVLKDSNGVSILITCR